MLTKRYVSRWARGGIVGAVALLLAGCITIPAYDSKTDELLTGLQSDTDTFIAHLSNTYDTTTATGKACAYSQNVNSYQQFHITLGLISTRANALYNDAATVKAVSELSTTFDAMEAVHKGAESRPDHCILPVLLTTNQTALDSAIGAILKLELAKKGVK